MIRYYNHCGRFLGENFFFLSGFYLSGGYDPVAEGPGVQLRHFFSGIGLFDLVFSGVFVAFGFVGRVQEFFSLATVAMVTKKNMLLGGEFLYSFHRAGCGKHSLGGLGQADRYFLRGDVAAEFWGPWRRCRTPC